MSAQMLKYSVPLRLLKPSVLHLCQARDNAKAKNMSAAVQAMSAAFRLRRPKAAMMRSLASFEGRTWCSALILRHETVAIWATVPKTADTPGKNQCKGGFCAKSAGRKYR